MQCSCGALNSAVMNLCNIIAVYLAGGVDKTGKQGQSEYAVTINSAVL